MIHHWGCTSYLYFKLGLIFIVVFILPMIKESPLSIGGWHLVIDTGLGTWYYLDAVMQIDSLRHWSPLLK